jgi:hypothetical protein
VFPLYHVLADVGEFAGGEIVRAGSGDPLRVDGLALRKDGRTRVLLANLTAEPQRVDVENLASRVRVRFLDETNAEEAMQSAEGFRAAEGDWMATEAGKLEIELRPYGVVRIDGEP